MAQLASALIFMMLFIGCGAALQRMIAGNLGAVADALAGPERAPAVREFRVLVRPSTMPVAGRATS